MGVVAKIDAAVCRYVESGPECPDFVFISPDLYNLLLVQFQNQSYTTSSPTGFTTLSVWTAVGEVRVKCCAGWIDGTIVAGDHPILGIMQKLGDIV